MAVVLKSAALAVLRRLFRQLAVLWHLALLHVNVCRTLRTALLMQMLHAF